MSFRVPSSSPQGLKLVLGTNIKTLAEYMHRSTLFRCSCKCGVLKKQSLAFILQSALLHPQGQLLGFGSLNQNPSFVSAVTDAGLLCCFAAEEVSSS